MSATVEPWRALRIATDPVRSAVLANPRVRAGLAAYFERYERHNGDIPTISGEELAKRCGESS